MGKCCSTNDQKVPKINVSSCDRTNCTVTQATSLIKYSKWNPLNQTEKQNKKRKEDYDHYTAHHAKSDNRSKNKCVDPECKYENNAKGTYTLSLFQRYHVYFYHNVTYTKLKTQRSCHYQDESDIYTVLTPAPKPWNENSNPYEKAVKERTISPFLSAAQFEASNPDLMLIDNLLDQLFVPSINKLANKSP
eukprot:184739_1